MKVRDIIKTCEACPSQWDGHFEDGRMFYVRYRWGHLIIRVSPDLTDNVHEAVEGKEILSKQVGDSLNGFLDDDQFRREVLMFLDNFEEEKQTETGYGER